MAAIAATASRPVDASISGTEDTVGVTVGVLLKPSQFHQFMIHLANKQTVQFLCLTPDRATRKKHSLNRALPQFAGPLLAIGALSPVLSPDGKQCRVACGKLWRRRPVSGHLASA